MIVLQLLPKERNYSIEVNLDNDNFLMRFLWNPRAASWFFDLAQLADGLLLLDSVRISVGTFPLRQFVGPQWPKGQLYIFDTSGQDLDPGESDLGERVQVHYLEALAGEVTARV